MSGHNKWSQIKQKKGATDAKRSKLFSMLVRAISIEAKRAKGDLSDPGLKGVISRAKDANMPADNITRAVEKASGAGAESYEELVYEAYGPGGVAIIIEALTDNKNRTTPEIKHLLSEFGLSLEASGSALWAFAKEAGQLKAQTLVPLSPEDQIKLAEIIEKLEDHDDVKNIITNVE
ncbi:MAG: YebC/PmpR family DNA-binding transcriptional regulator [Patescibacteria group bacterium]